MTSSPTRAVIALLLLGVTAAAGAAQQSDVHTLDSEVLGRQQTLTVYLPASYEAEEGFAYPVVYLLDGETNASYSVAVADFLAETAVAPEMITVAVHAGATRTGDYLPESPATDPASSGNADRFLDHLEQELIPFVEANFRAAPLRLVSGHSIGGVLVTHAMLTRPHLFTVYMAQSPYLVEDIAPPLLARAEQEAPQRNGEGSAGIFFFANLGDEPEIAPHFDRLGEILSERESEGFRWTTKGERGMTHMETRLVGHYDGLEHFFGDRWRFPTGMLMEQGITGLETYIEGLNSSFGYEVLVSESSLQQAVQVLFSRQDVAGAGAASELYVDYYPSSPIAHFLRANAHAAGGARDAALDSVERAIALYEAGPTADMAAVYEGMKQLRAALAGVDR